MPWRKFAVQRRPPSDLSSPTPILQRRRKEKKITVTPYLILDRYAQSLQRLIQGLQALPLPANGDSGDDETIDDLADFSAEPLVGDQLHCILDSYLVPGLHFLQALSSDLVDQGTTN